MLRMPIFRAGTDRIAGACVLAGAVLMLSGCVQNGERAKPAVSIAPTSVQSVDIGDGPGIPMSPEFATVLPTSLGDGKIFVIRSDPFALSAIEANFDRAQSAESLLMAMDWDTPTTLSLDTEGGGPRIIVEPVPQWRLSGIIIANGVLGILEMGVGGDTIQIRPGTKIPGTEWTVVSIDSERAILRREGNKRPLEFAVNLQGPLPGSIPYVGGGGAGDDPRGGGRRSGAGAGLAPP